MPEGSGGPASDGRPAAGLDEWALLVGDAMRSGAELPRPEPEPEPGRDVLAELFERIRRHVMGDADSSVLVYGAPCPWTLASRDGGEFPPFTGVPALMERLREQEAVAERGRWLFARVSVTRRDAWLERAYDHWPSWVLGDPSGTAADLRGLRAEMAARSPEWRPAWTGLLDRWAILTPAWPGPPHAVPSVPPERLDTAERQALLDEIGGLLAGAAPGDWLRLRLSFRALVGYAGGTLSMIGAGEDRELSLQPGLRSAMAVLRSATYERGRGAWFGAEFVLERSSGWRITYDRDGEPDFAMPPRAFSYALDARYFPRDVEHTPPWLAERLRAARQ